MTTRAIPNLRTSRRTSKRIHQACLHNLALYLQGALSFEEWSSRQEELESRLSPEPELPLHEGGKAPGRPPKAA